MMHRSRRRFGFTVVELIVVVGVIAILMGLLLPALAGVRKRGRKAEELNDVRQIGLAFQLYAQNNDDAALPGYVGDGVQSGSPRSWNVRYRYADKQEVPKALARHWPHRLAPYFDHDPRLLVGYRGLERGDDKVASSDTAIVDLAYGDSDGIWPNDTTRPQTIALQPAFGYNGYYIGGWWEMVNEPDAGGAIPRHRFGTTLSWDDPNDPNDVPGPLAVVAKTVSQIRSTRMVLFCSTTLATSSSGGSVVHSGFPSDRPGAPIAVPRFLGLTEIWRQSTFGSADGPEIVQALNVVNDLGRCVVPIGRHTGQAAVLRADLATESVLPGTLDDMQLWVNGARKGFTPAHQ